MRRVQKGGQTQALGRSCGGFSPKIHGACDPFGNPMRCLLTGGEAAECTQALRLLERLKAKAILADKGDVFSLSKNWSGLSIKIIFIIYTTILWDQTTMTQIML
jgi:hypothetical protein